MELRRIGDGNVLIPSVSIMELYQGMENKKELKAMQAKIAHYNVLHFNEHVSEKAIELIHTFRLSHNLQIPDAIIGAMSVIYCCGEGRHKQIFDASVHGRYQTSLL